MIRLQQTQQGTSRRPPLISRLFIVATILVNTSAEHEEILTDTVRASSAASSSSRKSKWHENFWTQSAATDDRQESTKSSATASFILQTNNINARALPNRNTKERHDANDAPLASKKRHRNKSPTERDGDDAPLPIREHPNIRENDGISATIDLPGLDSDGDDDIVVPDINYLIMSMHSPSPAPTPIALPRFPPDECQDERECGRNVRSLF